MTIAKDITVVGAGPYGMSLAAHLNQYPMEFHVLGKPMDSWRTKMPKGMSLKSAGFASNLSDPQNSYSLRHFCMERDIPYGEVDFPISLETFCDYGMAFKKRFLSHVEQTELCALSTSSKGFELRTSDGQCINSRKVIIAVGIDYFRHVPQPLTVLAPHLYSHSADHRELDRFRGRSVAVLGSGASAIDIAVLLHEAGACVQHLVRRNEVDFGGTWRGKSDTFLHRLRSPISSIGPGWKSYLCVHMPWLYRYFSDQLRLRIIKTHLGPSPGWFMRDRATSLSVHKGVRLVQARERGTQVELQLAEASGSKKTLHVDHVIAATGYENDVRRLPFMSQEILEKINMIGNTPRLSAYFESSVPGLYFIGGLAGTSFGPVMRFVAGADFASKRVSAHLSHEFQARKKLVKTPAPQA